MKQILKGVKFLDAKKKVIDISPKLNKMNKKVLYFIPFLIILGLILSTSWYMVQPDSVGVVWTLGKITTVTKPGLHFKAPFPAQWVNIIPSTKILREEIGFKTVSPGGPNRPAEYEIIKPEAQMLTGDENIVFIEFIAQYKISDPIRYLKNISHPSETFEKAAEAAMRLVIGQSTIDDALTTGKALIQDQVQMELQQILDTYQSGISVVAIQLQNVNVPNEVQAAFKKVVDAKEEKQARINKAQQYRNTKLPEAQGEAQKYIEDAEGYKYSRVENAKGDVARFAALQKEYSLSKNVTKTRLYYEMLNEVLPQIEHVYITDGDSGDLVKYLPLKGGNQ